MRAGAVWPLPACPVSSPPPLPHAFMPPFQSYWVFGPSKPAILSPTTVPLHRLFFSIDQ